MNGGRSDEDAVGSVDHPVLRQVRQDVPTQSAAVRSGVKAIVTASRKSSVVPVFAATVRSFQWRALLQPKIKQRFWSSA